MLGGNRDCSLSGRTLKSSRHEEEKKNSLGGLKGIARDLSFGDELLSERVCERG